MAQRRMFSPQIVKSEEFLSMPISSQALYFHLGMDADDDGFIQPKIIMRSIGAADDDLKVLLTKRFLLSFESGVVVIKHWLIHNLIQKDRYHPTRFQEEKKALFIKENKAYTDSVNKMLPEVRLGKVNIPSPAASVVSFQGKGKLASETPDDGDLPQPEEEIPKTSLSKLYNQMLDHMANRRSEITNEKFAFIGQRTRHYKALKILREQFKITPQAVFEGWDNLCYEYNDSKFLQSKGFDLYDLITRLTKKG